MESAFSTRLSHYRSPHGDYRGRCGHLHVPGRSRALRSKPSSASTTGRRRAPARRAVPHERVEQARKTSFTPARIAELYDFPRQLDGSGQRIAVIELGGGFRRSQLRRYFEKLGKPMPKITAVSVDGVRNRPGIRHSADGEVVLDLEVIGAIVPGAEQLVYFAPTSDRGFVDAVTTALFDPRGPSIMSISWGQAEGRVDGAGTARARPGVPGGSRSRRHRLRRFGRQRLDGRRRPAAWPMSTTPPRARTSSPAAAHASRRPTAGSPRSCGTTTTATRHRRRREPLLRPARRGRPTSRVPASVNERGGSGRGVPDVSGNADPDTGLPRRRRREPSIPSAARARSLRSGPHSSLSSTSTSAPRPASSIRSSTSTSTARSSTTSRPAGTAPTARAAAPGMRAPATARPAAAHCSKHSVLRPL